MLTVPRVNGESRDLLGCKVPSQRPGHSVVGTGSQLPPVMETLVLRHLMAGTLPHGAPQKVKGYSGGYRQGRLSSEDGSY